MTIQFNHLRSSFFSSSIADGYRAAILLLGLPLLVDLSGEIAAQFGPSYRFPAQAIAAAALYATAVHLALSAWQKPGVGSRLVSVFSLVVALLLPLMLRTILA